MKVFCDIDGTLIKTPDALRSIERMRNVAVTDDDGKVTFNCSKYYLLPIYQNSIVYNSQTQHLFTTYDLEIEHENTR